MPAVSGDRFSSQNMADCSFCPSGGRRFRTQRQCSQCGKPLCLACRPEVPGRPFLCPECGGGAVEDAVHQPGAAIDRITEGGHRPPYWLLVLRDRLQAERAKTADELITPE